MRRRESGAETMTTTIAADASAAHIQDQMVPVLAADELDVCHLSFLHVRPLELFLSASKPCSLLTHRWLFLPNYYCTETHPVRNSVNSSNQPGVHHHPYIGPPFAAGPLLRQNLLLVLSFGTSVTFKASVQPLHRHVYNSTSTQCAASPTLHHTSTQPCLD